MSAPRNGGSEFVTRKMNEITKCVRYVLNIINHSTSSEIFFYHAKVIYNQNIEKTDYDLGIEFYSSDTDLKFVWRVDARCFEVGIIDRRSVLAMHSVKDLSSLREYIRQNLPTYTEWMRAHSVHRSNRVNRFLDFMSKALVGYKPKRVYDLETDPEGLLFDLNFNGKEDMEYILIPNNSNGFKCATAPFETAERLGVLDFGTNTLFPRQLLFEKYTEFEWSDELRVGVQEVLHNKLRQLVDSINDIGIGKETLWLDENQPIISAGRRKLVDLLNEESPVFYGFRMQYKTCEELLYYYLYKELSFNLEPEDKFLLFNSMRTL